MITGICDLPGLYVDFWLYLSAYFYQFLLKISVMQFTDYDNYLDKTVRNLLGDLARENYLISNWQVFAKFNGGNVVSVTLRFVPVSHEGQPVDRYNLKHKSPSTIRRDRSRYNERRQLRFDSDVTPLCNKSISCNLDNIRTFGSSVKPISTDSGYCSSDIPVKVVPDSDMQYSKGESEHDSSLIEVKQQWQIHRFLTVLQCQIQKVRSVMQKMMIK